MEKRLFAIMTIGAVLTAAFGFLLLYINSALLSQIWFQAKLALLAGLVVYHLRCLRWIHYFESGGSVDNTRWLRWFNEIPVVFLLGMIFLAVVKPA